MRNLKRVLSLAVASVMLLGMMVVGTSAASYPDVAQNEYEDAIYVMQLLGVMEGDEKGNFNPDQAVNRNEMAVILTNLMNLKSAAKHPFTDVPAWAEKYVAAVYANGVTAGTSATTYGGSNPLDAAQAALMIEKALGYFEYQGEFGDDWTVAAIKRATTLNLFENIDVNVDEPMTRAALAQMIYNALDMELVVVEEIGGMSVEGNGITVTQKPTYNYYLVDDGMTLMEKLFDEDLSQTPDADDFKRPATTWGYDGEEVKVVDKATKTYIGAVELGTIYADLGLKDTLAAADQAYFVDGVGQEEIDITEDDEDNVYGDDGQIVELYYDVDADVKLTIVAYNTYLGVIVDNEAKNDDDDAGVKIDVLGVDNGVFFETAAEYDEDELVLVTYANSKVQAIVGAPKVVEGAVSRRVVDDYLTVNGTKYYVAAAAYVGTVTDDIDSIDNDAVVIDADNNYALYLDQNDNILAIEVVDENVQTDLVYVYDATIGTTLDGKKLKNAVYATVVYMDGTSEELLIGEATEDELTEEALPAIGEFATLSYDEDDDEYALAPELEDVTAADLVADVEIKTSSKYAKLAGEEGDNYYLNNSTTYVFITVDDKDTIDEEDDTIKSIEVKTGAIAYETVAGEFVYDSSNRAKYVVVEEAFESAAKDILYVHSASNKGETEDGWVYEVYMDTNTTKVEVVVADTVDANGDPAAVVKGYYEYTVNSDGSLDLKAMDAEDGVLVNESIASIVDNMYGIYDLSDVVIIDTSTDSNNDYGAIKTLAALKRAVDKDYVVVADMYVNDDDEVVTLVVKSAAIPEV